MAQRVGHEQLTRQALRLAIRGVVQGVGFRPFLFRLAAQHQLAGWVRNTSWGVELEIEGLSDDLEAFVCDLPLQAPPIARIESIARESAQPTGAEQFVILLSQAQDGAYQLISPDIATCPDCLRELGDPADRRYRYPFTNCTNCGPRFTIIEGVPYDRPLTTMRAFTMCPDCQREYDDPADRRFHAQPNACPVCGPQVVLCDQAGRPLARRDEAMRLAAEWLRQGRILAVKGLGGFQLACDATNPEAVARLRQRKQRPHKPFAVMVADLAQAEALALLTDAERELLTSTAAPIVLVRGRPVPLAQAPLATGIGPDTDYLGLMLPYTPLHHVLLGDVGRPLVMTSGNLSEEPIARDNEEALRRLGAIADGFLWHDRPIHARYDDSVWFVPHGGAQPVRRARGYAPFPIRLPFHTRPTLVCGAELKATFCLTRDNYAFVSQHIGDMQNLETLEHYRESVGQYRELFHVVPERVVYDMHPDYETRRFGQSLPGERLAVQHHHAHLAACLADNGLTEPVIGVVFDGTGLGLDGRIWGGEWLVGDGRGFQRAAHLQELPLPGGDAAVRKPYRIALAYLQALGVSAEGVPALAGVPSSQREMIERMVTKGIRAPLTTSAGRLFDAVAALLGLCPETSYEAQAAIRLEVAADAHFSGGLPYPYEIATAGTPQTWGSAQPWVERTQVVQLGPLFSELVADVQRGVTVAQMAWRFHLTLAHIIRDLALSQGKESGLGRVALSGGCFQNRLLLSLAVPLLQGDGLQVLLHRQVPTNDGGVALGQAFIAHYQTAGPAGGCGSRRRE